MNAYLIDTHILLWWVSENKKLTKSLRTIIENPDNEIWVSTVTVWEIAIKKSLNKLQAPDNLKEILELNSFNLLSLSIDHALAVEHLPHIHNDPFDRLLIAQAIVENLTFITADELIHKYKIKCL